MAIAIKRSRVSGALSLTPLIDVLFLLLIFFIVATRFSKEETELDVELPSASQALPLTSQPAEFVINIDGQGKFYIGGQFRQPEEIEKLLKSTVADNPLTQTVVIRADKESDWQHVSTAFDLCKKVGIYEYTAVMDGSE